MNNFKKIEISFTASLIVFSIYYYYLSLNYSPISRIVPNIITISLFIFSSILLLNTTLSKKNLESKKINIDIDEFRLLGTILFTFFYIYLINTIGFTVITPIYLFILMLFLGFKNIIIAFLISIIFSIAIYVGFKILLGVPIPSGVFF